jgi:hypothetical protein
VVEDIAPWHLEASSGAYEPRQGGGLTARGYDNQQLQTAIAAQPWHCILALGKPRRVPSPPLALTTPKTQPWGHIATFVRHHRWLKWPTIRILTHGTKRQRMAFRPRDPLGSLRYVGQGQWVCAEPRKRPEGRRQS